MSEHICHLAAAFDTRNLCRALGKERGIEPTFNEVWNDEANDIISQLGGVTRRADKWSAEMIAYCRQESNKGGPDADPNWRKKLSFILSALSHRSIDRHMKPVFMHFKQKDDFAGYNECTIYCDVLMLNKRFGRGTALGGDFLDPLKTVAKPELDRLMRETLRRELIAIHTLNPDDDHIHNWLDGLINRGQAFNIKVAEYERIFTNPDSDKWNEYLVETNFYDESSPLIEITQRLVAGESVGGDKVQEALDGTTIANGRYAKTLKRAVEYIKDASRLWRGELTVEETKPKFDIGIAELAMVYPEPGERAAAS
jgi:hypothetical protein